MLEVDGVKVNEFENCSKKAAVVREKYTHLPWFSSDFTFLFSNSKKFYSNEKEVDPNDKYTRALDPGYGYVKLNTKSQNDFDDMFFKHSRYRSPLNLRPKSVCH